MATPEELRQLGSTIFRTFRDVANQLEVAIKDAKLAETQQLVYDEVVDNLASKEREAVQQEMANLRSQIASLNARIQELEDGRP